MDSCNYESGPSDAENRTEIQISGIECINFSNFDANFPMESNNVVLNIEVPTSIEESPPRIFQLNVADMLNPKKLNETIDKLSRVLDLLKQTRPQNVLITRYIESEEIAYIQQRINTIESLEELENFRGFDSYFACKCKIIKDECSSCLNFKTKAKLAILKIIIIYDEYLVPSPTLPQCIRTIGQNPESFIYKASLMPRAVCPDKVNIRFYQGPQIIQYISSKLNQLIVDLANFVKSCQFVPKTPGPEHEHIRSDIDLYLISSNENLFNGFLLPDYCICDFMKSLNCNSCHKRRTLAKLSLATAFLFDSIEKYYYSDLRF